MFVRIYVCLGHRLRVCLGCCVSWRSTAHTICVSAASPWAAGVRRDSSSRWRILSFLTGFFPITACETDCVCVSGLHRWAAALPALLQSVCAEHTGLSEPTNYRLSFPQTGTSAQVNLPSCHTHKKSKISFSRCYSCLSGICQNCVVWMESPVWDEQHSPW